MNRSVDLREDLVFAPAGLLLQDYLAIDWASTPLGPVSAWPASLRTALTICLTSQFPVVLLWGPQFTLLYNQAYLPMVGRKHPGSLGAPCDQAWSEIWPIIGPMLTGVLAGESAIYSEDQMFLLERQDFAEECYFTFSYSPIPDDSDGIGGVFTALTETTAVLFAARRVALVQRLGDELTAQTTGGITGILQAAISTLGDSPHDLSDTAIYHCDESGTWTRHGSEQLLGPSLRPPASHRDQRVQIITTTHGRVALVPMAVGPRSEGLLACQLNPQVPEDSHLVAFFTQIGRLIGAALTGAASWTADNARITAERVHHQQLVHSERRITEVLHRSLLPTLPALTDLTVAARYAPGESDAHIGGDWYDAIDLGAGRTALIIGDVMGHGVIAAGIMSQLRSAVRAYSQLDLTPAEILTLIDLMVDQMWETSFVTSLYGVYDPADRSLTLANAGHFAPLLVTGSGPTVTTLAVPPDPPLGTGRASYLNHRSTVPPGSVLALFTDGLVESRHHDIDDGLSALSHLLGSHAGEPLEDLADHILIGMRRHHQHDDDTALLLLRSLTEPDTPANTGKGSRVLTWTVQPGPNAVHHGRAQILAARHRWGLSQETVDDAQLVLSELITNALRHGTPPLHVQLRATTTSLYLEVADASPHRPRRRGATSTDENGRGLLLVNAYARRWGIRARTTGKVVWAELALGG